MNVLIVDDNADVLELLRELLRFEGVKAQTAMNGVDALWMMRQQPFDLILLDMFMPKVNGLGVLKSMKDNICLQRVPVIAMSAFHENRQRALDAGAVAFIPKPFDIDLLLEEVKKYGARELV